MQDYEEYILKLKSNPADPIFVNFAEKLILEKRYINALEVLLSGLSYDFNNVKGRVLLAEVYYAKGYIPFSFQILDELLKTIPNNPAMISLCKKVGFEIGETPGGIARSDESKGAEVVDKTLAEIDFDES